MVVLCFYLVCRFGLVGFGFELVGVWGLDGVCFVCGWWVCGGGFFVCLCFCVSRLWLLWFGCGRDLLYFVLCFYGYYCCCVVGGLLIVLVWLVWLIFFSFVFLYVLLRGLGGLFVCLLIGCLCLMFVGLVMMCLFNVVSYILCCYYYLFSCLCLGLCLFFIVVCGGLGLLLVVFVCFLFCFG